MAHNAHSPSHRQNATTIFPHNNSSKSSDDTPRLKMSTSTDTVTLWCTLIPNPGKENDASPIAPSYTLHSSLSILTNERNLQLRTALLKLSDTVKNVETECIQYQVIESTRVPDGSGSTVVFNLLEQYVP